MLHGLYRSSIDKPDEACLQGCCSCPTEMAHFGMAPGGSKKGWQVPMRVGWWQPRSRGRGQLGQPGLFHSVVLTSNGNSYVQLGEDEWWCSTTSKELGDLLHPMVRLMVMANLAVKVQGTYEYHRIASTTVMKHQGTPSISVYSVAFLRAVPVRDAWAKLLKAAPWEMLNSCLAVWPFFVPREVPWFAIGAVRPRRADNEAHELSVPEIEFNRRCSVGSAKSKL